MPLDWWGRRPAPAPELAAALADLDRLGRDRPELNAPARALAAILRASFHPAATEGTRSPPQGPDHSARIAEAAAAGEPYFRHVPPPLVADELASRGEALCVALRPGAPDVETLRRLLRRDRATFLAWAHALLAGHPEVVAAGARAIGLDPSRAASILRMAMLPALAACSAAVAGQRPEGTWQRGDCPNCGDPPLLAESRGLEQKRFLRCGLCAAAWPADRLRCPSCGEADPRALSTLDVEGQEGKARLVRCASCGSGLKVASTFAPFSAPGLLVADLATVHLDFLP